MTWSIIARDASGAFGVAIATRFFAVGALCPHAQSGVGALSTQALVNPHYGAQGLELLGKGLPAPEVVQRLIAPDEGREHRQLHVIDAAGRIAQHTGAAMRRLGRRGRRRRLFGRGQHACQRAGDPADGARLPRIEKTVRRAPDPRARRQEKPSGGDKRGKQSAALLICSTEDYPELNLRVDDHADPLAELNRLYHKAHERFVPYLRCSPSKARPWGVLDRAVIEQEIARHKKPA